MEHFQTNWKSFDGLGIFAQGWKPAPGTEKAVICLVHGIGEHIMRFAHVAEAFNRKGLVLFGSDLRGHGRSEGPRGHFPSSEAVMRDIDLLIGQAEMLFPGKPVILYGHSLGGTLVLHYVLKRKPRLRGVMVTSPGLRSSVEEQKIKVIAAKVLGTVLPETSIPSGLDMNQLSHDPEVASEYRKDPLVHDRMSFGFGKAMLDVNKWTLSHAGEFSLPLLIIHGKSDLIAYPSGSSDFAQSIKDNCTLVLWENGYHELHNEPFREEVFKTMTDWIEKILT